MWQAKWKLSRLWWITMPCSYTTRHVQFIGKYVLHLESFFFFLLLLISLFEFSLSLICQSFQCTLLQAKTAMPTTAGGWCCHKTRMLFSDWNQTQLLNRGSDNSARCSEHVVFFRGVQRDFWHQVKNTYWKYNQGVTKNAFTWCYLSFLFQSFEKEHFYNTINTVKLYTISKK